MSTSEFMDPTAAKIVLSVQRGDSINRIAEKIDVSYSWVYDWIERLEAENIIATTDSGVRVVDHELRGQYAELMAALYRRDTITQEDAYVIPHFAGMEFAHTAIDAAYIWTNGGYQIARSHDDYPVFVAVHDRDLERWLAFFERFGVHSSIDDRPDPADVDGAVHYVLFPVADGIDSEWVDGHPVITLEETIDRMVANRAAYEPALEIVAEHHDVDVDATHHDPVSTSDGRGGER